MTKVILSHSLREYQRSIVQLARECIRSKYIDGLKSWTSGDPVLAQARLLSPPYIECMDLSCYEGKVDDLILLAISDDFGLENVHLVLKNQTGKVIESGDAFIDLQFPGIWNYFTTAAVPPGTTVTVHAVATDQLWGIGTYRDKKTT